MKPVGKITHYYDRLGVAIVELADSLRVGDKIKIEKNNGDAFEQQVLSIHKNYEPAESAGEGDVIGLKVDQPATVGALVILV
jgi:translation elongation factor EF-1alpha